MTEHVEIVVAGAGVVGLAAARALAQKGREVIVAEAEPAIGTGVSSRSSEVIHAGIYYPKDSLKAQLCVSGRHRLYEYCGERGVPFRRTGKFIVATTESEVPQLESIGARARNNGVDDLVWRSASEMARIEPELRCAAALFSPSTGIIDSHAFMLSLQADAERAGAVVALGNPVVGGSVTNTLISINTGYGGEEISCDWLINAAGLGAVAFAGRLAGFPARWIPRQWLCKGHYFSLRGCSPFSHLVYPVPEKAGLGVHLTLDMAGQARFGPDTEWTDKINYDVDDARAPRFYDSIRRYWPDLPDGALQAAYAGIRPKISGPSDPAADFRIDGPSEHGVPGVINLFGFESPGLTASLAIADCVTAMIN